MIAWHLRPQPPVFQMGYLATNQANDGSEVSAVVNGAQFDGCPQVQGSPDLVLGAPAVLASINRQRLAIGSGAFTSPDDPTQ